jgi:hypothetical protein
MQVSVTPEVELTQITTDDATAKTQSANERRKVVTIE